MRGLALFVCASACLFLSGCGAIFQTAWGWSEEEKRTSSREHRLEVTGPTGGQIYRVDAGKHVALGNGQVVEKVSYEVSETVETPNSTVPLLIGGLVDVGLAIGGGVLFVSSLSDVSEIGSGLGGMYLMVGGGMAALADLIFGFIFMGGDEKVVKSEPLAGGKQLVYGYEGGAERTASVPWVAKLDLVDPRGQVVMMAPPPAVTATPISAPMNIPPPKAGANKSSVLAIMNADSTNTQGSDISTQLLKNITDQLRIFLGQQGVRTVDRGTQDRALREQVDAAKQESYKACYDQSCQIELGKALAANYIVRPNVTKFGKRCVLNAEIIDLRTEVTMGAASAAGTCEDEGFLNMAEEVAGEIATTLP